MGKNVGNGDVCPCLIVKGLQKGGVIYLTKSVSTSEKSFVRARANLILYLLFIVFRETFCISLTDNFEASIFDFLYLDPQHW